MADDKNSASFDFDQQLSALPKEQMKLLTDALTRDIKEAALPNKPKVNSPSFIGDIIDQSIDTQALIEYRNRHALGKKGDGAAKLVRQQNEYWELVVSFGGPSEEEAHAMFEKAKEASLPAQLEWEKKQAQRRTDLEAALSAMRSPSIDFLLATAKEAGITWNTPARSVLEAAAAIIEENRDGRYSEPPQLEEALEDIDDMVATSLSTDDLSSYTASLDYENSWGWRKQYFYSKLDDVDSLLQLVHGYEWSDETLVDKMIQDWEYDQQGFSPIVCTDEIFSETLFAPSTEAAALRDLTVATGSDEYDIQEELDWTLADWRSSFCEAARSRFPEGRTESLVRSNPRYAAIFAEAEQMTAGLLSRIPDAPIDLYPLARSMERHFVLHVGPTNSGKTHDALEALATAPTGVYLAPLRLLAFEQYEKMNDGECPCALLTGEESRGDASCGHLASTIEMLDFGTRYDVVVIDEAQMMADPDRGHRWTAAILGAAAAEVHVCMSADAEPLVIELIEACSDTYEVVRHERKTPLVPHPGGCQFPGGVLPGDAVVVFSRRAVHAVADELSARGFSVSLIYGALPYDVRHAQAEKFASGESDVVVATDAIGMGMNLPIKRVVFLEQAKYDGHSRRFLTASEVQQIAGRAGRYGIHEQGTFASVGESKKIRQLLSSTVKPQKTAPLGFATSLLGADGPVSVLMSKWASLPVEAPFTKNSLAREINLAEELESELSSEDARKGNVKLLVYKFATMPFKDNIYALKETWLRMFRAELSGTAFQVVVLSGTLPTSLMGLEDEYAMLDLLFQYCRVFGYAEHLEDIQTRRDAISEKMMEMLDHSNVFEPRQCRECGKKLPWNHPYPMCQKCHDELYPPRYRDYDYW